MKRNACLGLLLGIALLVACARSRAQPTPGPAIPPNFAPTARAFEFEDSKAACAASAECVLMPVGGCGRIRAVHLSQVDLANAYTEYVKRRDLNVQCAPNLPIEEYEALCLNRQCLEVTRHARLLLEVPQQPAAGQPFWVGMVFRFPADAQRVDAHINLPDGFTIVQGQAAWSGPVAAGQDYVLWAQVETGRAGKVYISGWAGIQDGDPSISPLSWGKYFTVGPGGSLTSLPEAERILPAPTHAPPAPSPSLTPPVPTPSLTRPAPALAPTLPPLPDPTQTNLLEAALPPGALPGFALDLPGSVRAGLQIARAPFDPQTGAPPAFTARLSDYPWTKTTATLFVFPVADYLYHRPQDRAALEQVRVTINSLLADPAARAALPNVVPAYTLGQTYLPQAGSFNDGVGLRAVAMLAPGDGNPTLRPHYAYWGFSADMQYLLFAAFPASLTLDQPARLSAVEFQQRAALFDRDMGFTPLAPHEPPRAVSKACPDAPETRLQISDWARVRTDPDDPLPLYREPGGSQAAGQVSPGANVQVLAGPQCASESAWWLVRGPDGAQGWAPESDSTGDLLVEPVYAWHALPPPIQPGPSKTFDLRELRISPAAALVDRVDGAYYPLATPLPTPANARTPAPADPRTSDLGGMADYAAHSVYQFSGVVDGSLRVTDLQDPLSRSFLVGPVQPGCVADLRRVLDGGAPVDAAPAAFCGRPGGSIPLHFQTGVKILPFSGGKGIRYLAASANYLTINRLDYIFQGLSDDGRYFISFIYQGIRHPYLAEKELFEMNLGPLTAWRAGQYEEAAQSYQVFNQRVEALLAAGHVHLYPALDLLDALVESIEIQ